MSLMHSLEISAAGMDVERQRLEVAAFNIANANTTRTADGSPFHRRVLLARAVDTNGLTACAGGIDGDVPLAMSSPGGVAVDGVVQDNTPGRREYMPGHPDADAQGWVTMPNVEPVEEMVDVMQASRAYEANAAAFSAAREMATRALDMAR